MSERTINSRDRPRERGFREQLRDRPLWTSARSPVQESVLIRVSITKFHQALNSTTHIIQHLNLSVHFSNRLVLPCRVRSKICTIMWSSLLEASKMNPFGPLLPTAKCQGQIDQAQGLVKNRVLGAAAVEEGGNLSSPFYYYCIRSFFILQTGACHSKVVSSIFGSTCYISSLILF